MLFFNSLPDRMPCVHCPGDVVSLRPEFRSQIDALRKRVHTAVRPKTVMGRAVNGTMLCDLAHAYCDALNANQAPEIATAWERVVDRQCEAALEAGLKAYHDAMTAAFAGGAVLDSATLDDTHARALAAGVDTFRANAVKDTDKLPAFETALRDRAAEAFATHRTTNAKASTRRCEEAAAAAFAAVAPAFSDAAEAPGATVDAMARQFRRTTAAFEAQYTDAATGPAKWEVLATAIMSKLPPLLETAADSLAARIKAAAAKQDAALTQLKHEVVLAETRARAAEDRAEQDKAASARAMEHAAAAAAKDAEHLRNLAESRLQVVESLGAKQDALVAAFEREANRADDRVGELVREVSASRTSLEALTAKMAKEMGGAAAALSDLAAARARIAELEAELGGERLLWVRWVAWNGLC